MTTRKDGDQKEEYLVEKFNLQLFAEGGEGAEGAVNTSAEEEAENTFESGESEPETEESLPSDSKEEKTPFSELIKNEYKDDFTEEVNKIISKRYKNEKTFESKYDKLKESFVPLMERFEVKTPEELIEKLSGDERKLSEEAMERGMELEDYKRFLALKADNRRKTEYIERIERRNAEAERARAHEEQLSKWNAEAEEVKKEYPDFELSEEVGNKSFLTALRMGVGMKDAYRITHPDVYRRQIEKAERKAALEAQRAKSSRPTELGTGAGAPARETPDVKNLTDKEMEDIRRRVMQGEKITFS